MDSVRLGSTIAAPSSIRMLLQRPWWILAGVGAVVCAVAIFGGCVLMVGTNPSLHAPWGRYISDVLGWEIIGVVLVGTVGLTACFGLFLTRALEPRRVSILRAQIPGSSAWKNYVAFPLMEYLRAREGDRQERLPRLRWTNYLVVSEDGIGFWQRSRAGFVKVGWIPRSRVTASRPATVRVTGTSVSGLILTLAPQDGEVSEVAVTPSALRIFRSATVARGFEDFFANWIEQK